MNQHQERAIESYCSVRGFERLPESAYGEHVMYVMMPVPGRKTRVRVPVTMVSYRAWREAARSPGVAAVAAALDFAP